MGISYDCMVTNDVNKFLRLTNSSTKFVITSLERSSKFLIQFLNSSSSFISMIFLSLFFKLKSCMSQTSVLSWSWTRYKWVVRTTTGHSYFFIDETQLYVIFQKKLGATEKIISKKLKSFSIKKLTNPTTTDNSFSPAIKWHGNSKFCPIFIRSCWKQNRNATYTLNKRIHFLLLMN